MKLAYLVSLVLLSCQPIKKGMDARKEGLLQSTDTATSQTLPEIPLVDATKLEVHRIKLSEINVEGHSALRIEVEKDERAEFFQFFICTLKEPKTCRPAKGNPDLSYLHWIRYPVPPSDEIQVSAQACVEEEHAEDPLFNCGSWVKSDVFLQKENHDKEIEKQLVDKYENEKLIVELCDGILKDLREYQENPEEGDEATDTVVANQTKSGKVVCVKAMQSGEAKTVSKSIEEQDAKKENVGALTILSFGVLGIASLVLAGVSVKIFMDATVAAKYHKTAVGDISQRPKPPKLSEFPAPPTRQQVEDMGRRIAELEVQDATTRGKLGELEARYKLAATTALNGFLAANRDLQPRNPLEWTFEQVDAEFKGRVSVVNQYQAAIDQLQREITVLRTPQKHYDYYIWSRDETDSEKATRETELRTKTETLTSHERNRDGIQKQLDNLRPAYTAFQNLGLNADDSRRIVLQGARFETREALHARTDIERSLADTADQLKLAREKLNAETVKFNDAVIQRQQRVSEMTNEYTRQMTDYYQRMEQYTADFEKRAGLAEIETKFGGKVPDAQTLKIRGAVATVVTFGSLILLSALIVHTATQQTRLAGESKTDILMEKLNRRYDTYLSLSSMRRRS